MINATYCYFSAQAQATIEICHVRYFECDGNVANIGWWITSLYLCLTTKLADPTKCYTKNLTTILDNVLVMQDP